MCPARSLALVLSLAAGCGLSAGGRAVAITVDDLPYTGPHALTGAGPAAWTATRQLLGALQAHRAPATGFVIQKSVEAIGAPIGERLLREWVARGFDLGNHTYSHPDVNTLGAEQIESEIDRGAATIGPMLNKAGKKLTYFRFPMNHTGDTREKHAAAAAALATRGYKLATCTIDVSDYLFNQAYVRALERDDKAAAARVRAAFLAYTAEEIDYYAALAERIFGYEPPEVMLLHVNDLDAATASDILDMFRERGYRFVSLREAQSDPAYRTADTYVTKFGPMWGYRWAKALGIEVDGRREPEPPAWISEYATTAAR